MNLRWRVLILVFLSFTLALSIYAVYSLRLLPDKVVSFVPELRYVHEAEYKYNITLWPSTLYDNRTVLMPDEVPFIPLVHLLNISITYRFSSKPVIAGNMTYWVICSLEAPVGWRKKFTLTPPMHVSFNSTPAGFEEAYVINITKMVELINTIEKETRTYARVYYLRIHPYVKIAASMGSRVLNESFEPEMMIKFMYSENNRLDFEGLEHRRENTLGKYVTTELIWVRRTRYALYALSCALLASLAYTAQWTWKGRKRVSPLERAMRKYRDIIIDAVGLNGGEKDRSVVMVRSLDDLVKVSDEVLKPIIHERRPGLHVFYVLDDDVQYEFTVKET
ncbi:MAG: hypothetical protein J7L11_09855 [Thermoprotei archaeon]|nr:hypothetical protein [Thermoprotei archaeon]